MTDYKVRTQTRTRTLTSGVKQVSKRYIVMYMVNSAWWERPDPFTHRVEAVAFGKALKMKDPALSLKYSPTLGYWVEGQCGYKVGRGYYSTPQEAVNAAQSG